VPEVISPNEEKISDKDQLDLSQAPK